MPMSKAIVFVVIIVAVIAGAALYSGSHPAPSRVVAPAFTMKKAPEAPKPTLSSDVSAIDVQMASLNTDASNITQSINDQPVDPTL